MIHFIRSLSSYLPVLRRSWYDGGGLACAKKCGRATAAAGVPAAPPLQSCSVVRVGEGPSSIMTPVNKQYKVV